MVLFKNNIIQFDETCVDKCGCGFLNINKHNKLKMLKCHFCVVQCVGGHSNWGFVLKCRFDNRFIYINFQLIRRYPRALTAKIFMNKVNMFFMLILFSSK